MFHELVAVEGTIAPSTRTVHRNLVCGISHTTNNISGYLIPVSCGCGSVSELRAVFVPAFVSDPCVLTEAAMPKQQRAHGIRDKWCHGNVADASALRARLIRLDFRAIV
jgi:hypothetical protein